MSPGSYISVLDTGRVSGGSLRGSLDTAQKTMAQAFNFHRSINSGLGGSVERLDPECYANMDPDLPLEDHRAVVRNRYPFVSSEDFRYPIGTRMRSTMRTATNQRDSAQIDKH